MTRIHFSVEDLARTRFCAVDTPTAETLLAMRLLGHGGGALFRKWQTAVRSRLGAPPARQQRLFRSAFLSADFFTSAGGATGHFGLSLAKAGYQRDDIAYITKEFFPLAIAPYWNRIRSYLEAERSYRGRIILNDGIEGMLRSLQPMINWNGPVLETAGPADQEIHLNNRGLLIVPSLFLFDQVTVIQPRPSHPDEPPVLVYPVPVNGATANSLWQLAPSTDKALGALVGRTRAKVLRTLVDSHNTGELGLRVGVSAAAASQHTAVLREAGLIITRRKQNTVLHSLTPLGLALLNSRGIDTTGTGEMADAHRSVS
nr:ArsR family transcriptional regulator [uncultured bacterium]